MVRVYAIASAKGGVGKTTTTANLGATLAETGADVVVIDGDIGMANLGAALGVRPHGATLHDALSGDVEPVAAAYDGPAGLTVVPGDTSLEAFSAADPQNLQRVVEAFDDADFVLIDVGAGVSHETSVPLSVADAVLLVSTPERDALVDTEKTRQLTERLGGAVAGAVITRTDEATPVDEITSGTLTADVLTTVPEDEAVRESIAVGEPLVSYAPHSDAAAAYRQLVTQLTGIEPSPPEPAPTDDSPLPESAAEPDQQADDINDTDDADDRVAEAGGADTADRSPESTADSGVTIDAGTDAPDDTSTEQPSTASGESDDDHNVVNPFAAKPEADDSEPEGAESKWAEAATGTGGDESSDGIRIDDNLGRRPTDTKSDGIEISPEADAGTEDERDDARNEGIEIQPETAAPSEADAAPAETDATDEAAADESVPRDAIPFGSDAPNEDEDSSQTTVLGDALDEDTASADGPEKGTTDDSAEDDEPLIPDAEETAAAAAGRDADDTVDEDDADDDDGDDEGEKRGFFSRLFG